MLFNQGQQILDTHISHKNLPGMLITFLKRDESDEINMLINDEPLENEIQSGLQKNDSDSKKRRTRLKSGRKADSPKSLLAV